MHRGYEGNASADSDGKRSCHLTVPSGANLVIRPVSADARRYH